MSKGLVSVCVKRLYRAAMAVAASLHARGFMAAPTALPGSGYHGAGRGVRGHLLALLVFATLLGIAPPAQAGTFYCSEYGGVIDGYDPVTFAYVSTTNNTLGIDQDCKIINWPVDNGIGGFPITNINYWFPGGADYYIVFDNVYYPGNMSCNDPSNSNFWIYWAPGSFNNISDKCQAFMVPVDVVVKDNPAAQTTASIGVPFTYTITAPKLGVWDVTTVTLNVVNDYDTEGDVNNLVFFDDLSQTGASLTYVTNKAYLVDVLGGTRTPLNSGNPLTLGASATWLTNHSLTVTDPTQQLVFSYENNTDLQNVPLGYRVDIEVTVLLDDVAANTPGLTFTNTADMWFDKQIIYNCTVGGVDTTCTTPMLDLHAVNGITDPLTIAEPDLVVTKSSSTAAMNLGSTANYTVFVQNAGGSTAWETSILDTLPIGMCDYFTANGTGATAVGIYDATGTILLRSLAEGAAADYTLTWTGDPTCELGFTMVSANAAIAPTEQLIITYPGQLDGTAEVTDGSTHTNTVIAQQWYNADSLAGGRKLYGPYSYIDDTYSYADSVTITATLSGYFFKKSVINTTTGESPATSAAPGDTLHYTLLLENYNVPSLTGISITDELGVLNGANYIVSGSLSNWSHNLPGTATVNFNATGGSNGAGLITASGFDLAKDQAFQIDFDVTVGSGADGNNVQNQAMISGYDTGSTTTLNGVSDDPFVNGPIGLGSGGDITEVTVLTGGALSKQNDQSTATIGEQFSYSIRVPASPVNVPLYDVVISDDLTATGVDLKFVSAEVLVGSSWTGAVTNTGTGSSDTNLVLQNDVTGIDIPANGYVDLKVTVELLNTTNNVAGDTFHNQATYTYDRTNGGGLLITPASDPATDTTADMTVIEPYLTVSKAVEFVSPAAKDPLTDPATVGDVLRYTVTIDHSATSTSAAYDLSVVDILPADVSLVASSATASLYDPSGPTTTPVAGFVPDPDATAAASGTLIWGGQNGDGSLDIPLGQSLILTYEVTVEAVTGSDITNTVYSDWTSWDGTSANGPRTGDGCPTVTAPNTYCAGPAQTTVTTQDNTALAKQVASDTYAENPPSAGNPVVRVGDTITYELVLSLQDYTTKSVVVTDSLPAGMELVSYTYDPGTTTFTYIMNAEPTAPASGLLTWDFGDIYNDPSTGGGNPVDDLVIRYVARVKHGAAEVPDPTPTTQTLTNGATLSYTGYDPANSALSANAPVEVLQPQIATITKNGTVVGPAALGSGTDLAPYDVDIINNSMHFTLEACNGGDGPAYGLNIADKLAAQFDLGVPPVPSVYIWDPVTMTNQGAAAYAQSSSLDPVDGSTTLNFTFTDPVDAKLCARVEYDVGFRTDIAPNTKWWNSATVTEYWSRETLNPLNDREYVAITPVATSSVYLINSFDPVAPTKTVALPSTGEVTIGDPVSYTITVPGDLVNAGLSDVKVTDSLHPALIYDIANPATVEVNGVLTAITPSQSGQDLTWSIPSIPAGQQAVITLNAYVTNTVDTDAGVTFPNIVSYTYDVGGVATSGGSSDPLTATLLITEPAVTLGKSVENLSNPLNPPVAGDVLRYTLQLDALSGPSRTDAFDITIIDDLSLGLDYIDGLNRATINGAPLNDPINVTGGDGDTTAQQLRWSLADGHDIDIPEGGSVIITYDVLVLNNVVAGQALSNSAVAQWTSRQGVDANERDGSDGYLVEPNDYETAPQTRTLTVPDNSAFTKSVVADSDTATPVGTLRVGDTVDYQLNITLQEGTTTGISVEDTLQAGLVFDSIVSINGDTVADYAPPASGAGSNFTYGLDNLITAAEMPTFGATGTLTFTLGDISNDPLGDATTDTLTIVYRARVATTLTQAASTTLINSAVLAYNTTSTLSSAASVTVLQPVMSAVTKLGNGAANTELSKLAVNVISDTVHYTIESCNNAGQAPAYNVQLTDTLATQLDEGSIKNLTVAVDGAPVAYSSTLPAGRGGSLIIELANTVAVNPLQCVTVEYDIGFYTDFGPNETWINSVTLDDYWSLSGESGKQYAGSGPATFWMTNAVATETPLSKHVVPLASEITVGELVTYEIRVPESPVNAALDGVKISDSLNSTSTILEYVSYSHVSGPAVIYNNDAPDLTFDVVQIPAGEQVVLRITARVLNNDQTNAGVSFTNTAAYTYTGMTDTTLTQATSEALTIVEPELTITKSVINTSSTTAPLADDILHYEVTITASGGNVGDQFSAAFDLLIVDVLSPGLSYRTGTAALNGTLMGVDPVKTVDGTTGAETLTWDPTNALLNIDVLEGNQVVIGYDVDVLPTADPGQILSNSATVQWTGINDDNSSVVERNGAGCSIANDPNDYCAGPVTTTLTSQYAVTFTKSVVNATTSQVPGDNATPGDTLQYTLVITNDSVTTLTNGAVVDELAAEFAPGTLNVSVSGGLAFTDSSSGTGGVNGSGIVDINGISLAPQGSAGDTLTIVFDATLATVIPSGTTVLNQAQLNADALPATSSNQSSTLISSAPLFEVWKSSQDLTGDTAVLVPGDTLRYTITVQNIGTESAVNAVLRDLVPANTTYVANSTTLNGATVSDLSGTTALQNGMLINAPEDTTAGVMRADASGTTSNVATITFDVVINDVFDGTVISNQGYVTADGAGSSGPVPEEPTDDPSTAPLNDPTLNVVGNVPSVDAQKLVAISVDGGLPGVAEAGDQLLYTITVTNNGTTPATNVLLTDAIPANTAYVVGTVTLNGNPVADVAGVSALVAGMPINSADTVTPGTINPGQTATVTFEVTINAVAAGTVISNQGTVSLDQQVDEPTDFDGIDSNGDQPTTIVVGAAQQLAITKEAFIVGGGAALPGSTVEYLIRVTNTSTTAATNVVISDNLDLPVAGQLIYMPGSATMNGSSNGVDDSALPLLTADYGATYGDLLPGGVVTLRFRVQLDAALTDGTEILNTATVEWNGASQTASATARLVVGGFYGVATLKGQLWHDANFNNAYDGGESLLANWNVDLYRNGTFVGTTLSDASGNYTLTNIQPNDLSGDLLEVRFRAPGAGATTAMLGLADSIFTDGQQNISGITLAIGDSIPNLNLPIDPNGVVYESIARTPVAGATLTMLDGAGVALPSTCFDDPVQQGQVTLASGYYKFDLLPGCLPGDYVISVSPPASGFDTVPSRIIPPTTDAATAAYSVPTCSGDAIGATANCEVQSSEFAPAIAVPARTAGTVYYLHLTLDNPPPENSQLFNNHIPLDPELAEAVAISKSAARVNVSRGELVPYTITVNNSYLSVLDGLTIIDTFPAGFKYVEGSSRYDGTPLEPTVTGNQLRWENIDLDSGVQHTLQLLLVVSSGVAEGEYVNRAQVINAFTAGAVSGEATATVRVVPDPTFDCTDIIGKVFDDKNLNGVQDAGEAGLPGARVVTARGLIVTADAHGRFHITCAAVPNESRGSNFILKLDDRSLPSGYRVTTENPRVQRLTRGKMAKFNFGATIHHVVRLDVADGVFEPGSTTMRPQWQSRIPLLLGELKKAPAVLRISYLADVEAEGLVRDRLAALKALIAREWEELDCCYRLTVESEVYWRRGAPPERSGAID